MTAKKVSELLPQTTGNLCRPSPPGPQEVTLSSSNGLQISLYEPGQLTPAVLASQIKKLQVAFPGQDTDFFNLLAERLVANRFSDRRLREAVSHMIDTFPYRRINIADVISFDRRVRLYTYGEVCDMVHGQTARFDEFELREVGSKKYWIRKTESKPPCTKSAWV